jgi:hypothetical protein
MAYSLDFLTQKSEADALLNTAQRDKRTLEVREQSLSLRTANSAEDSVELQAELNEARLLLETTNSVIATLPEGDRKEDEITKKMDLELKIRKLTRSGSRLSPVSKIENEYELDQLDRQLAGIDAFITEVTARKEVLA